MSHPDDGTIERFVMGGLDDDADFVAHVAGCEECSRKLRREAEVELAMFDVQARASAEPSAEARPALVALGRAKLARRAIGPALVFAAAAATLVWVGRDQLRSRTAREDASAVAVVTCPDGPRQLDCIAEAHRTGKRIEYPDAPIARLGSERGLSVIVEPRESDGNLSEVEALLATLQETLVPCAEASMDSREAPVRTGEVGVSFTVAPDGRVEETRSSFLAPPGREADFDASPFGLELALSRCMRGTTYGFPFRGNGQVVRISLTAKYVWRE